MSHSQPTEFPTSRASLSLSFANASKNERGESNESEHLREERNLPTRPIVRTNAESAKSCCSRRCEDHCDQPVLNQFLYAIQPRNAVEKVPQADRRNQDLNRIGWNEPGNRTQRYTRLQIIDNKACKCCESQNWPESLTHEQQHRNQQSTTGPKRPDR